MDPRLRGDDVKIRKAVIAIVVIVMAAKAASDPPPSLLLVSNLGAGVSGFDGD